MTELDLVRDRVANLERFITRLGHDLTTPLTTVSGFASLLARDPQLSPGAVDAVARIQASSDRANRMLRALVDETRLREAESMFVADVIDDAVGDVRDGGVEVTVHRQDTRARVFTMPAATRRLIETIVLGLAARGAPEPLSVSVVITQPEQGDMVSISFVTDVGSAFTEAERDALERAHLEVDDAQESTLSLAARLATTQAGRLWAEDVDGGGIRLILALPRCAGVRD